MKTRREFCQACIVNAIFIRFRLLARSPILTPELYIG
jgi:hypothetical protein